MHKYTDTRLVSAQLLSCAAFLMFDSVQLIVSTGKTGPGAKADLNLGDRDDKVCMLPLPPWPEELQTQLKEFH